MRRWRLSKRVIRRPKFMARDLSDRSSADDVFQWVSKNGWHVDVLCNNAGIGFFGDFNQLDESWQLKMIDVNIVGLVQMTKRFLPGMIERDKGRIMMI